jgi:hypothetical protein
MAGETPTPGAQGSPQSRGTNTSTLSEYAGPYVTGMLGKTQALAESPYQTYQGPLTAGPSNLQSQVFQGLGALTVPRSIGQAAATAGDVAQKAGQMSYGPTQFNTGTFGAEQAQQYMNPYLQAALNPQLEEARRQSQITQLGNQAKATQAGAYGGGRSAIMEAEGQRALGTNLANITGQGYNTAYTNAMGQFNADQARQLQAQQAQEASKQFGANYGLQGLQQQLAGAQAQGQLGTMQNQAGIAGLNAQMAGGQAQRDIEQQGVTADYNEFLQQRDFPMKQLQFQQSMLQGLPISTVANVPQGMTTGQQYAAAGTDTYALLQRLGIIPK